MAALAAAATLAAATIDLTEESSQADFLPTQEEEEEAAPSLLLGSFQCAVRTGTGTNALCCSRIDNLQSAIERGQLS